MEFRKTLRSPLKPLNDLKLFLSFSYDTSLLAYIIAQTIHVIHTSWFVWLYLGGVYTVNLFYCVIILFFSKRFQYLSKKLKKLDQPKLKLVDNRRLSRIIYEYNRTLFELMEMNDFFKVGISKIFSFQ